MKFYTWIFVTSAISMIINSTPSWSEILARNKFLCINCLKKMWKYKRMNIRLKEKTWNNFASSRNQIKVKLETKQSSHEAAKFLNCYFIKSPSALRPNWIMNSYQMTFSKLHPVQLFFRFYCTVRIYFKIKIRRQISDEIISKKKKK